MNISYTGSKLMIGDQVVETPWHIREAFEINGKIIALLDQHAYLKGPIRDIREMRESPKGRNLFCYSDKGSLLWKAEFPDGDNSEDYYYKISSRIPLQANTFSSFRCEIDPDTGRIKSKIFLK